MPKVYVVTKGSYSDFHILGVFSTRKLADQFAKNNSNPHSLEQNKLEAADTSDFNYQVRNTEINFICGDYSIHEFELDKLQSAKTNYKKAYYVMLSCKDGNVVPFEYYDPEECWEVAEPGFRGDYGVWPHRLGDVIQARSFVSKAHALKLAAEGRQAWLRDNKLSIGSMRNDIISNG